MDTPHRTIAVSALVLGLALFGADEAAAQQQENETKQATVGNVVSALNNISVEINELEALNDLTIEDVRVVNVEDVFNDNNIRALNNALNRNEVHIVELHNVLNDNEIVKNALNNNNVAVGDVVAVDVLSGGDVTVYVQGTDTTTAGGR